MLLRGDNFDVLENQLALGGRLVDLRTPTTIYTDVFVPLHGRHQGDNASVALTAVEAFFAAPIADDIVREGFANVRMPGRFEVLGHQPLVIVDGAHNPPGADSCAQVFFDDFDPAGRKILVAGILKGRDAKEMLSAFRADEFDAVYTCTAPTPRGMSSSDLAAAARDLGCDTWSSATPWRRACDRAIRSAEHDDAFLVTGSLYVVGAARPHLRKIVVSDSDDGRARAVASSAMSDRTLVLLKPDTVERGLIGEVLRRFESKGLTIAAMDLRTLDADTLARHYEEHVGKGFYADLVAFMSRGPVVAMVLEGPEDTWEVVRTLVGATNPRKAAPGTIRGDLGILFTENLVHGSDSLEAAQREIGIFFPNL